MRRLIAVGAVAAVAFAGACGDSPKTPGEKALAKVQDRLESVDSGVLSFQMLASSSESAAKSGVGFSMTGPFAVARTKGQLPKTDLRYTRITGTARSTTRLLTTASNGFVYVDGVAYHLPNAELRGLRSNGDDGGGGLEGLDFTDWIEAPKVTAGPTVDGVATQSITGKVDPVGALNDVLGLAHEFGSTGDVPSAIAKDDAATVRRAVRATTLRLYVGKVDKLLRRFQLSITLATRDQGRLRAALKSLAGVRIAVDLSVAKPNQPVTVRAPSQARPASELPRG